MAASSCLVLLVLPWLAVALHSPPGCKIRITSKGLDLGKGPRGTQGRVGQGLVGAGQRQGRMLPGARLSARTPARAGGTCGGVGRRCRRAARPGQPSRFALQ